MLNCWIPAQLSLPHLTLLITQVYKQNYIIIKNLLLKHIASFSSFQLEIIFEQKSNRNIINESSYQVAALALPEVNLPVKDITELSDNQDYTCLLFNYLENKVYFIHYDAKVGGISTQDPSKKIASLLYLDNLDLPTLLQPHIMNSYIVTHVPS